MIKNPYQIELSRFNEAEVTENSTVEKSTIETITYKRKKTQVHHEPNLENLSTEKS
ncbi:hypothetical protein JOC48_003735 [Aquibacillus albus]|uniref:Uncharacterized protein n=1 Tax=Aquibacillus albus TaxID=1168171 RepID=A0ABS2N522_9BACI|nr:hypothetical protein [Aquibacillus albus]